VCQRNAWCEVCVCVCVKGEEGLFVMYVCEKCAAAFSMLLC